MGAPAVRLAAEKVTRRPLCIALKKYSNGGVGMLKPHENSENRSSRLKAPPVRPANFESRRPRSNPCGYGRRPPHSLVPCDRGTAASAPALTRREDGRRIPSRLSPGSAALLHAHSRARAQHPDGHVVNGTGGLRCDPQHVPDAQLLEHCFRHARPRGLLERAC